MLFTEITVKWSLVPWCSFVVLCGSNHVLGPEKQIGLADVALFEMTLLAIIKLSGVIDKGQADRGKELS